MPLINTSDINQLIHAYVQNRIKEKRLIVVPVFQGQRGNPVLFSSEFRNDILDYKKESGCRGVIMNYPESVKEIEMDNDNMLLDVDTLEDYQNVSEAFVTK
jgi:CTP:molybdopterin cytidylyltransferase MocA